MHIPDLMLQGNICPVTAAISVIGIIGAAYYVIKSEERINTGAFAATTALIFALQMMNFPISEGTSGHLLGGVLVASLLGTPFSILSLALVVTIQSLIFSDGGLTVLGANIFNMAIIGAGLGGWLRSKLATLGKDTSGRYLATALAAWLSIVLASFAVSVELALDAKILFADVASVMVGTHAIIGIGEAIITVLCGALFSIPRVAASHHGAIAVSMSASIIIALLLSPFASEFPDGLEWVAAQYGFLHQSAPAFVAPIANYTFPYLTNETLSTGIAGLIGVMITFGLAWGLLESMNYVTAKRIKA